MVQSSNRDIYRIGLDGTDLVRLTTSTAEDGDPTVAGGTVVFTSTRDGNSELYSMPLTGGAQTRLTSTSNQEKEPALSPDGTRLLFTRTRGGDTRVYRATLASMTDTTVVSDSTAIEGSPAWHGNSAITYMSALHNSADIWEVTPPARPVELGWGKTNEVDPAWSVDGSVLAFATTRDGDTNLYAYRPSTGTTTRILQRTGADGNPSWLRDGRLVFVCYGGVTGICWIDPAAPSPVHRISTPAEALKPAAVVY
jgi:Tol biopolymer transport system component